MIPSAVIADCEMKAEEMMKNGKPKNWVAGILILFIWALILIWMIVKASQYIL